MRLDEKADFHAMKSFTFLLSFQTKHFFSLKNIDTTVEGDLRSRRVAYVFVVFVHFGFTVISLLIHHVDFGMELFAQSLRSGGSC